MSRFASVLCQLAIEANTTTDLSNPHSGLRSHGVSIFTIGESLVSRTLQLVSRIPKRIRASLVFHFCVRSNCPSTLAARSGFGILQVGQSPVIIPRSHVLLEAFMLLYVRDFEKRIGGFSMSMICYIGLYVDRDGFLEIEQLPEPLLALYRELRKGEKPVRQWTKELQEAVEVLENSRTSRSRLEIEF
jgi:hypothetical protein